MSGKPDILACLPYMSMDELAKWVEREEDERKALKIRAMATRSELCLGKTAHVLSSSITIFKNATFNNCVFIFTQ